MQKKYIAIAAALLVAIPVLWYLVSPLFLTKRVHETMDDLLKMSLDVSHPGQPTSTTAPTMDPSSFVPPAGKDPKTESKGPTSPPPSGGTVTSVRGVGQGTFEGLAGHTAQGKASLLQIGGTFFVRLEDDFYVTNGPDVFIGLGKNGEYDKAAQIAPLKGNEGSQNYEVPADINAAQYNEIWIWCRTFSVPFGKARLN